MKGDILIQKVEPNIVSQLIGFFTRSCYCHAALCISDKEIIEATFEGVKISPISNYKNYELYRVKEITDAQIQGAIDFCKKEIGDQYDYLAVVYLGFQFLTGTKYNTNSFDAKDRWWCSELVDAAFESVGINLCPKCNSDNVSPDELASSEYLTKQIIDSGLVTKVA